MTSGRSYGCAPPICDPQRRSRPVRPPETGPPGSTTASFWRSTTPTSSTRRSWPTRARTSPPPVPPRILADLVEAVLPQLPPGSTLALACRAEPALPLGRLRAHHELIE